MDILMESFKADIGAIIQIAPRLGIAILVMIFGFFVGKGVRRSLRVLLQRLRTKQAYSKLFEGVAFWACVFLALIASLGVLGLDKAFAGFIAGGGIAAIVVGFAFREIGENLLAGLMLAVSKPFEIGDIIRSLEHEGEVKELSLRATHIRASDGRDIFIPNSQILTQPLVNYTIDGLRRLNFRLGIDYKNNPSAALELLVQSTAAVPGVLRSPAPVAVIRELAPEYIDLEVGFWVDTKEQETVLLPIRTEVIKAAREVLQNSGFTFSSDVTTNLELQGSLKTDLK